MAFSSVLSFLLSTHSADCPVPLLLSVHCINSALFLPFTLLLRNHTRFATSGSTLHISS